MRPEKAIYQEAFGHALSGKKQVYYTSLLCRVVAHGDLKMEELLAKLNLGLLVPLRSFTLWTREVSLPSKMCPGHNCEMDAVYT